MSTENEDLILRATFGKQVENFLSSDVGSYIIARADEERSEAMSALVTVNPAEIEEIRKLQSKAELAIKMKQWLISAVTDGLSALQILEDRE